MKHSFFLLFVTFSFVICKAQNDTIWFRSNWETCKKKDAVYFRPKPIETDSGFWVKDYYLSGKLQYECLSQNLKTEDFVGVAKWYNEDGTLSGKMNFRNIIKEGILNSFYEDEENKPLKTTTLFKNWKREGVEYGYYFNGNKNSILNWNAGLLHGECVTYFKNGEIRNKGYYKNGFSDSVFYEFNEYGKLREKRFFVEGITIGELIKIENKEDTVAHFYFENNLATGKYFKKKFKDTTGYYILKNGLLDGNYIYNSEGQNNYGIFSNGKLLSWNAYSYDYGRRSYKRKLLAEIKMLGNEKASCTYYYNTDSNYISTKGNLKNGQLSGDWIFFNSDGLQYCKYKLAESLVNDVNKNYFFNNTNSELYLPDYYNGKFSEWDLKYNLSAKLKFAYKYIQFDNKGENIIEGNVMNNIKVGSWKYKKTNKKILDLNFDKSLNKEKIYPFFDIVFNTEKNDDKYFKDRKVINPFLILISKSNTGTDKYSVAVGALVEDVCIIDKTFYKYIIAQIKKKLKDKFTNNIELSLINKFTNLVLPIGTKISEKEGEYTNTQIPILLKNNLL